MQTRLQRQPTTNTKWNITSNISHYVAVKISFLVWIFEQAWLQEIPSDGIYNYRRMEFLKSCPISLTLSLLSVWYSRYQTQYCNTIVKVILLETQRKNFGYAFTIQYTMYSWQRQKKKKKLKFFCITIYEMSNIVIFCRLARAAMTQRGATMPLCSLPMGLPITIRIYSRNSMRTGKGRLVTKMHNFSCSKSLQFFQFPTQF